MIGTREVVVADIGGTHARFAIATLDDGVNGDAISLAHPVTLRTEDFASLQIAWETYAVRVGRPLPNAAAIALAAPIRGQAIKLTNNPWIVRPVLICEKLGVQTYTLVNDFEALAHAVAVAPETEFTHICGPEGPLPATGVTSVIGPGTGLGVAAILKVCNRTHILPTEGGHSDFAPLDAIEDRILSLLRHKHTRVSVERVVAGPGLRTIWEALALFERRKPPHGDDATLWSSALAGTDSLAAAALDRFCMIFGAVAGDIALAHGPGTVVLAGGLGARLAGHLPQSGFAERFVAKGRYRSLMEGVPVKQITIAEPGLLGAALAFKQEHRT